MKKIEQMKQLKEKGLSYGSIGKIFGISRQRVHQLISGYACPSRRKKELKYKWLDKLFKSILERDNHKCQICGEGANFIHHIDKDNFNNNPNNLISICSKCHLELHRPEDLSFLHTPEAIQKRREILRAKWIKKRCPSCNKEFEVVPSNLEQICCSVSCSTTYRYKDSWQIKKCKNCGKEIKYLPSQWKNPLYCSYKCCREYKKEKIDKQAIEIYRLYQRGFSYREMIEQFNYSESWIYSLVKRGERLKYS